MITMRQRFYEVAAELLDERSARRRRPRRDRRRRAAPAPAAVQRRHPRAADDRRRRRARAGGAAAVRPLVRAVPRRAAVRAGQARSRPPGRRRRAGQHRRVVRRARSGRTHQAPADVALLRALPGWTIHVPGHPDEVERFVRRAAAADDNVYVRLSEEVNAAPVDGDGLVVVRRGGDERPARRRGRADARPGAGRDRRSRRDRRLPLDRPPVRRAPGCAPRCAAPTSSSSSPTSPAPRRPRSRRRSPTARTGCSPSASPTRSCAATAPARSTAPCTASTPPGSGASIAAFSARQPPPWVGEYP